MIPLRDKNPTTTTPVLTIALIALNVFVFFREPIAGSDVQQTKYFFCNAAIPKEVLSGKPLDGVTLRTQQGAVEIRCPHKNVWFSIFYSMFLHGGIVHIAGNMLFLWIFGNNVEDRLGRLRYLVFYFGAGLAATYTQSLVAAIGSAPGLPTQNELTPMVGASGAIAGVLGAYLLMFPRARVTTLVFFFFITVFDFPAYVVLGMWFVLQVFSGVASIGASASSGVAFFAHIGGFVAGMILLLILKPRREAPAIPPPEYYA
jgi:membrane associated rhomboid family serine protease